MLWPPKGRSRVSRTCPLRSPVTALPPPTAACWTRRPPPPRPWPPRPPPARSKPSPSSLTTKPETRAQLALHSAAFLSAKAAATSSGQMGSQPPTLSRPLPPGSVPTALLTSPPSFPATLHAHQALPVLQAQPLSLVTKSAH